MRLLMILSALALFEGTAGGSDVEIDYESPAHGAFEGRWPAIRRVQVCVSGPKLDFDSYTTIQSLLSRTPVYVSTNSEDIRSLLSAMSDHNDSVVSSHVSGYTHHFIFFEDGNTKVMHFRIFIRQLGVNGRVSIYPRSETKFGYSNGTVVPWIMSHYATNAVYQDYVKLNPLSQ